MWLLNKLRAEPEVVISALRRRGERDAEVRVEALLGIDQRRRALQADYDNTQAEGNRLARALGEQLRRKPKDPEADAMREAAIRCKTKASALSKQLQTLEQQQREALLALPNAPHPSTPDGRGEADNRLVRGSAVTVPEGSHEEPFVAHWDLLSDAQLNFPAGGRVVGAGFPFYLGQVARLLRGLIQYFMDKAVEAGYEEVAPPLLAAAGAVEGAGQLPDKEGQMYHLAQEPYYLIPTAEVPITNLWREQILAESQLPLRYVGHTPCFRREAGSWGADVRGLNRLHQFDKVEIVQISHPETSYERLEDMIAHVEKLLQALGLPYRLLQLCASDLGFAAACTYDFEVYACGQKRWLEVSSVSNFEAFQSQRMRMRYRRKAGAMDYPHTLNGSALALPRVLAGLLEFGQRKTEIRLPAVLHSYVGFECISRVSK